MSAETVQEMNEAKAVTQSEPQRTLTFGEKAVGISFNPSGDDKVNAIKQFSANLIDVMNLYRDEVTDGEVKAQLTLAIRKIQEGQMWGVKAVTWKF